MALIMVQEGVQPAGQYDLADGYTSTLKGGEVYVLASAGANSDGYQIVKARPALTSDTGPFFLSDDGLTGYGVLFGNTVTRTSTGFTSGADSGTRLGPASYVASGKVTLWDKPGIYAVSLDALDTGVSEATWKTKLPGAQCTVGTQGGALTTASGLTNPAVTVVTYKIDETLVTTGGAVVNHKKLVIRFNPFGVLA